MSLGVAPQGQAGPVTVGLGRSWLGSRGKARPVIACPVQVPLRAARPGLAVGVSQCLASLDAVRHGSPGKVGSASRVGARLGQATRGSHGSVPSRWSGLVRARSVIARQRTAVSSRRIVVSQRMACPCFARQSRHGCARFGCACPRSVRQSCLGSAARLRVTQRTAVSATRCPVRLGWAPQGKFSLRSQGPASRGSRVVASHRSVLCVGARFVLAVGVRRVAVYPGTVWRVSAVKVRRGFASQRAAGQGSSRQSPHRIARQRGARPGSAVPAGLRIAPQVAAALGSQGIASLVGTAQRPASPGTSFANTPVATSPLLKTGLAATDRREF